MNRWTLLPAALMAATADAQAPTERLRSVVQRGDSASLVLEVRQSPAAAQELLGELIIQAGRSRTTAADSALPIAHRIASAYATAWEDSFPLTNLKRFERMSAGQRAAKVVADSLRLAGNVALGSKGVTAALSLWRAARGRYLAIADTAGIAAATGNIGAGFYRAAELDSAEAYLTRARQLADVVGDRRTALNALGTLGAVAKERGDLRRAQEMYGRALGLRPAIGDVRGMAADHNNLGLISADLGDFTDARAHHEEALTIARQHQLDEAAAVAQLNLGNVASVEGEYAEATDRYREALALYRSLDNEADAALVLHNHALLLLRRGDYRSARIHLVQALGLFTRVGTVEDLVQVRRDLATVEAATGNLRGALDQLRRAEALLARLPERDDLAAAVALARADLAVQLNTYAEADRQFARAQTLYRRARDARGEAEALQGQAMLLTERKQYQRALEHLHNVARQQAAAGDRRPAAITRLMIAHVQHEQGRVVEARRTLEQALDTLRALGDPVGEAAALSALGEIDVDNNAPLAAEAHYRRGLVRLEGRTVPTVSWQLHAGLGRALRSRGALAEAAVELRAAIADVERMAMTLALEERRSTFLVDKWEPYGELALVQRDLGDIAASFAVSESMRARQMLELLSRGRVARSVTADSALVAREQDLRLRIGELTQRLEAEEGSVTTLRGPDLSGKSSGVTRERLARAQEHYAQLLLELRDHAGVAPILRGEVASWRAVAARLSESQALLTYLVTDSTTTVFVLTPDTVRALDLGVGRSALVTLIDFARGTTGRAQPAGTPTAWRTPLRRLYQHLIAPIEDAGLLAGMRQLIIVPHAELHYLPFAALMRRGEKDEFLIERYDVGYAPSASAWVRLGQRGSSNGQRVLALAPRSKDLPGSREEVESIRTLYGRDATVLTNGSATEQVFRTTVQRYGIVHLATYGVLNQHNPLFSFVELNRGGDSDGRLEVHEVFGLSLNARLLVLSACQTALASGAVSDVPAGDDWVGLVRAFLGAGAENVIATLWAVEDRSTARLMERMYRRLRAGDSEVAALSQAQRETLRNSATSGPFYWAGFVLVGGQTCRPHCGP